MRDWMDFDGDGEVDSCERMFAEEMLCTSKEGLDVDELELMDPDERAEALEEAGLDPDDYDFY